jgi:hypothetical protein
MLSATVGTQRIEPKSANDSDLLLHLVTSTRRSAVIGESRPQFVLEMPPSVDLVIIFKGSSDLPSKQEIQTGVHKAEQQYSRLLSTLKDAGLSAVGRRGEKQGVVLVLVACPESRLSSLMQHER